MTFRTRRPVLALLLAALLGAGAAMTASAAPPDEGSAPSYSSSGVLRFFTDQARAVERRPLDLEIRFESGSDRLTDTARRNLDEVGTALQNPALRTRHFSLAGHTDDVGRDSYNLSLSARRAESARQYLVAQYGIEEDRLLAQGFGETKPVIESHSEEARAANRRVELHLDR